jgi:hypothetical protein
MKCRRLSSNTSPLSAATIAKFTNRDRWILRFSLDRASNSAVADSVPKRGLPMLLGGSALSHSTYPHSLCSRTQAIITLGMPHLQPTFQMSSQVSTTFGLVHSSSILNPTNPTRLAMRIAKLSYTRPIMRDAGDPSSAEIPYLRNGYILLNDAEYTYPTGS